MPRSSCDAVEAMVDEGAVRRLADVTAPGRGAWEDEQAAECNAPGERNRPISSDTRARSPQRAPAASLGRGRGANAAASSLR